MSREKKKKKTHQQHNRQQKASLLKQKQTRPFLTYSPIKTWGKGFNKKGLLTPTESAAVLSTMKTKLQAMVIQLFSEGALRTRCFSY